MRLTETEPFADRTLDTLSGGERQRVFVARALVQQPRILLLDEPTSNLDVLHQLKVLDLVRDLVDDGLTAVASIHDLNMAARYCDRLVLLQDGRVLAEGPPVEVLTPETIESAFGVKSAVYRDPVYRGSRRESHRAGRRAFPKCEGRAPRHQIQSVGGFRQKRATAAAVRGRVKRERIGERRTARRAGEAP